MSQAPMRISLIGGGSDLPVFYEEHGGMVVSMAINLRQTVVLSGEDELFLATDDKKFFAPFRTIFAADDLKIHHYCDAPTESGLGSSASLMVALVSAYHKRLGKKLDKSELAEEAWDMENNKLGLYSGKQDVYAASLGGMNTLNFTKKGIGNYSWPRETADRWAENVLLIYTGKTRENPKIQENLKVLDESKTAALLKIKELAEEAVNYIRDVDVVKVSQLIRQAWEEKKKSNQVSNPLIDKIYHTALINGALSGKSMGSGGSGFMMFICEPNNQNKVIEELEKIQGVKNYDFCIDYNGVETRIINE